MKKASFIFSAFSIAVMTITSCGKLGTSFKEVTIGEQIWMAENLDIDKFRNGDPIPQVTTKVEMENANKNGQPAWCYYDFDEKMGGKYGKLYNWYAVNDPRGLAPEGWHVPQYYEWDELYTALGGKITYFGIEDEGSPRVGTKLMSDQLERQNSAGTNESKFNALPGGYGRKNGYFNYEGSLANWWSTTEVEHWSTSDYVKSIKLDFKNEKFEVAYFQLEGDKTGCYYSIRCVKDKAVEEENSQGQSSAKEIKSVKIGEQLWMTENLDVSKFRNGEEIPQSKTAADWAAAASNKQPAWCFYDFDPRNGAKVGKLYNWWAVKDSRGLAPEGWVIPTLTDWLELQSRFSGSEAISLKSSEGWSTDLQGEGKGNNISGFSALPGGSRVLGETINGWEFEFQYGTTSSSNGSAGNWWTSETTIENGKQTAIGLECTTWRTSEFEVKNYNLGSGLSVRCVNYKLTEPISDNDYNDDIVSSSEDITNKEVTIGKQVWMTENLNVDRFCNGDPIPQARTAEEWVNAGKKGLAAWCFYNNDQSNGVKYGKLYNWFAVNDPRGLAPQGWKIPSNSDFLNLTEFIGQEFKSKMMLETAWSKDEQATNIYGFSGLPSGMRNYEGKFLNLGLGAYFWTSTLSHQNFSFAREIGKNAGNWASHDFGSNQFIGMSIRCLRD